LEKYERKRPLSISTPEEINPSISAEDHRELIEIERWIRFPHEMAKVQRMVIRTVIAQLADESEPHIRARLKLMRAVEKFEQALEEYLRLTNSPGK
jgi:hypothetical protein